MKERDRKLYPGKIDGKFYPGINYRIHIGHPKMDHSQTCAAFAGSRLVASGPLAQVALALQAAADPQGTILVLDDRTGRAIDLDLRGSPADLAARLGEPPRERGRPKLGVVGREVTLLPRQWEWLATQPGGASVVLRRLVEEARRKDTTSRRAAQDAAYQAMTALAGDLPGFEEALRALYADDRAHFEAQVEAWPADIRGYVTRLAFPSISP
jgi:hypothetical protein